MASKHFKCKTNVFKKIKESTTGDTFLLELSSFDCVNDAQKTITSYSCRAKKKVSVQGFKCIGINSDDYIKIIKVTVL